MTEPEDMEGEPQQSLGDAERENDAETGEELWFDNSGIPKLDIICLIMFPFFSIVFFIITLIMVNVLISTGDPIAILVLLVVVFVFFLITYAAFLSIKNMLNSFPKSICFDSDRVVLRVMFNRYIEVQYSDIREAKQVDPYYDDDWVIETKILDRWNRYNDFICYTFKHDTGMILKMLLSEEISHADVRRYYHREMEVPISRLCTGKIDIAIKSLNGEIKSDKKITFVLDFFWFLIILLIIYTRALTDDFVIFIMALLLITLLHKWMKHEKEERRMYLERKMDQ